MVCNASHIDIAWHFGQDQKAHGSQTVWYEKPNKVRSLIGAFANANPVNFHKADGSGYEFHADRVLELDKFNPQVASRMVRALMNWRHYEAGRSELMRAQLERIKAVEGLSGDVFEIVSKAL